MTCFVIDPTAKTITPVPWDGGLDAIRQLIGFETIDSDEIDANGDRLFFDEKCFIRQTPGLGRFQLDSLAPVAGVGVVVGAGVSSPQVTLQALQGRVKFL
jgi:hypothetical protein